jgi:hypothetical protein
MLTFRVGLEADTKSMASDSAASEAPLESWPPVAAPVPVVKGTVSNLRTQRLALFGSRFPDIALLKLIAISIPPLEFLFFQIYLLKIEIKF